MKKIKTTRIILAFVIAALIITHAIISVVIARQAMDFKNWVYDNYVKIDKPLLMMDKPYAANVLYTILPAGILIIFSIFSLSYVFSGNIKTAKRKWPYITLIVLIAATLFLAILGNMAKVPIVVKNDELPDGTLFKDTPIWKGISDHWDSVKTPTITLANWRFILVIGMGLITIVALVFTIIYKDERNDYQDVSYSENQFRGFVEK